ncbi:hypothetical protein D9757_000877 [Collybiopsis confluens]|uniref:AB hydrolase-1 domain-containing protein n=1 Tax=Collybiopsis confluens TaxID=2823264 RepID=A0A8H5MGD7_9AGAR|nr:hypothetical protein D9757_000877 [Collybiopsis confluens]
MSPPLSSQTYTFDPRPHHPLISTAKRYWKPSSSDGGLTLVFTHAAGFHKEIWEAVMDDLLELINQFEAKLKIREIWSIDAPNCGDAASLNEEALQHGYDIFSFHEYARSVHAFLTGRGQTYKGINLESLSVIPNVDFSSHKIVGIGHSMGANSLLLSAWAINQEAAILISRTFSENAKSRKDVWTSREDAYNMFKSSARLGKYWDEIESLEDICGLRSLPTLEYPNVKDGVTLKCARKQETAIYKALIADCNIIYQGFPSYASRVRIHLVYGTVGDILLTEVKIEIARKEQSKLGSCGFIEGAGHYAPHSHPRKLAENILQTLNSDVESGKRDIKL